MGSPPPDQNSQGPLSPEQTRQIVAADRALAKLTSAARVASFNGITLAACAVLCLPFAVLSPASLIVAVALGAAAYVELKGRDRLRALDPEAANMLAFNQLAVLLGVYVYCAYSIYAALSGPSITEQLGENDALSSGMLGDVDELVQSATVLVYGVLIVLSSLFQGGLAYYYVRRGRALQAYLAETPAWILALQRQRG